MAGQQVLCDSSCDSNAMPTHGATSSTSTPRPLTSMRKTSVQACKAALLVL